LWNQRRSIRARPCGSDGVELGTEAGGFGAKIPVSITMAIEPSTSQRAHRILSSGSGNHSSSFRDSTATNAIGKRNNKYHGAPHRSNKCLNQPSTDKPSIPVANKTANVTLRPRQARQNQENPEKMFTRADSVRRFAVVKAFARSRKNTRVASSSST
jgi:hypothetical protein